MPLFSDTLMFGGEEGGEVGEGEVSGMFISGCTGLSKYM